MRSVASIGRWSMRRPWRAIALWLAFVVLAVGAAILTGTESLQNGAVGESARGYALMDQGQAWPPTREYAFVHPYDKAGIADVVRRMRQGLGTKPVIRVSRDRSSVLVVGRVQNRFPRDFRASVLAAQRSHPGVTIEESGDITASDAHDRVTHRDLHRAEVLSIPVTFLVLLFAFGAIVAAVVPVVLALTAVARPSACWAR